MSVLTSFFTWMGIQKVGEYMGHVLFNNSPLILQFCLNSPFNTISDIRYLMLGNTQSSKILQTSNLMNSTFMKWVRSSRDLHRFFLRFEQQQKFTSSPLYV